MENEGNLNSQIERRCSMSAYLREMETVDRSKADNILEPVRQILGTT